MNKHKNQPQDKPIEILSLDHLLPKVEGGVYFLARIAMLRAIEIHFGSPPLVENVASEKETTIALQEIAQNKISFKNNKIEKKPF